ncbi:class I SAM-dependent methyltransferase [uncultured Nostoc sp.]
MSLLLGCEYKIIGCGEGYCSRELSRRGAAWVHGIDLSQGMIAAL